MLRRRRCRTYTHETRTCTHTCINKFSCATRFQGVTSSVAYINASVVQGSVVGPASFITCASTLQPKHRINIQVKYADDAYLLIGSKNIHTAEEEMNNISIWAQQNNLVKNQINDCVAKR